MGLPTRPASASSLPSFGKRGKWEYFQTTQYDFLQLLSFHIGRGVDNSSGSTETMLFHRTLLEFFVLSEMQSRVLKGSMMILEND